MDLVRILDEIPPDFTEQCSVVSSLGLKYLEFQAPGISHHDLDDAQLASQATPMRIPYG